MVISQEEKARIKKDIDFKKKLSQTEITKQKLLGKNIRRSKRGVYLKTRLRRIWGTPPKSKQPVAYSLNHLELNDEGLIIVRFE